MIPRIIMSMGASRIEAVKDTTSASKQLSLFDYIVVKTPRTSRRRKVLRIMFLPLGEGLFDCGTPAAFQCGLTSGSLSDIFNTYDLIGFQVHLIFLLAV